MESKSDKELAVYAAVEYLKSWNSAERTVKTTFSEFIDELNKIYDTITKLDNR